MEKRVIAAFAISMAVLIGWSVLFNKPEHKPQQTENKAVTEISQSKADSSLIKNYQPVNNQNDEKPAGETLLKLPQGKYDLTFVEEYGILKNVVFNNYQQYDFYLGEGLLLKDRTLVFKKSDVNTDRVSFTYFDANKKIKKEFIINNSNYTIGLQISIHNVSNQPLTLDWPLVLGVIEPPAQQTRISYQGITVGAADKTVHPNIHKDNTFDDIKFIAFRDRYICAIIQPDSKNTQAFIKKIDNKNSELGVYINTDKLPPGGQVIKKFRIYLGPQDLGVMNSINAEWSGVLYYGTFDFIAHILLQTLEFLYRIVHNWGWAIILLGILIYLILYPLTLKQMRSMKEMQRLQPKIEALRKAHKDNPQKLNKEIMSLYKEHKVNPFGGCLPLILQIPIFFALYQVLTRAVALKGAHFLWIKDLSEPDKLITLPSSLPLIGNEINLLPILMAIGMFMQQKISTMASTSEMAEQQKLMTIILPLVFGFMFYHMPAGLVLYWFVNSTFMLLYQIKVNRAK